MDHGATVLPLPREADGSGPAIAHCRVPQPPHDVQQQLVAELQTDIEERRYVLDIALSGEGIFHDRNVRDTRDRGRSRMSHFGEHALLDEEKFADVEEHGLPSAVHSALVAEWL